MVVGVLGDLKAAVEVAVTEGPHAGAERSGPGSWELMQKDCHSDMHRLRVLIEPRPGLVLEEAPWVARLLAAPALAEPHCALELALQAFFPPGLRVSRPSHPFYMRIELISPCS